MRKRSGPRRRAKAKVIHVMKADSAAEAQLGPTATSGKAKASRRRWRMNSVSESGRLLKLGDSAGGHGLAIHRWYGSIRRRRDTSSRLKKETQKMPPTRPQRPVRAVAKDQAEVNVRTTSPKTTRTSVSYQTPPPIHLQCRVPGCPICSRTGARSASTNTTAPKVRKEKARSRGR